MARSRKDTLSGNTGATLVLVSLPRVTPCWDNSVILSPQPPGTCPMLFRGSVSSVSILHGPSGVGRLWLQPLVVHWRSAVEGRADAISLTPRPRAPDRESCSLWSRPCVSGASHLAVVSCHDHCMEGPAEPSSRT